MTPNILMSLPAVVLLLILPGWWGTALWVGFLVGFNFLSGAIGMFSFYYMYKNHRDGFKEIPSGSKAFLGKVLDIFIMILLVWQGHLILAAMQVVYFALIEGIFTSVSSIQKEMQIK